MSEKIKLYHVSFDIDNEPLCKRFVPRVPESHEYGEDNKTKRICFSDSIEGCLDSIGENKLPDIITGKTKIIVWEKVFSISDSELVDWKYLYENDLVCDAAMTHEYWYKKPITIEGRYYYILDLDKAIGNRETYWIVKSRYREAIVATLLERGANIEELDNLDLCYILNYWVPAHFNCYDVIHEKINQVLTKHVAFEEGDDSAFFQLFGHKPTKHYLLDKRERKKYKKIEIERA